MLSAVEASHSSTFCSLFGITLPSCQQRIASQIIFKAHLDAKNCFFIFVQLLGIHFPIVPVNLAVEEPGILDSEYNSASGIIRVKPTIAENFSKLLRELFISVTKFLAGRLQIFVSIKCTV